MLQRRQFVFGSLVGLAGLSLGGVLDARAQDAPTPQDVFFDPDNPVLGNPKGDVSIAEYFDFQCPYCKRDFPMVHNVVRQDGNVRLVMKDWPIFGAPSLYASRLSLAARTLDLHEGVISALMATTGKLSQSIIDQTLAQAGLDVDALKAAYVKEDATINAVVARNGAQAEAFGFPGTPAYVVGLTLYPGVLKENDLEAAIAKARGKA
jgi:protein-disulfide isomerase